MYIVKCSKIILKLGGGNLMKLGSGEFTGIVVKIRSVAIGTVVMFILWPPRHGFYVNIEVNVVKFTHEYLKVGVVSGWCTYHVLKDKLGLKLPSGFF
jgi:hypothetical protein